ncbi:hypothetical protein ACS0TY_014592 [Phlomoides rotata]
MVLKKHFSRAEAVIPVEIRQSTYWTNSLSEEENNLALAVKLDLLEEKRLDVGIRNVVYKQKSEKYYNSKVRLRQF